MRGFSLPFLLGLLLLSAMTAGAVDPDPAACRAARDAALARIAAAEAAFRAMLDADAAVVEAPAYHLSEAEKALRDDLAAERARLQADFRACREIRLWKPERQN